MHLTFIMIIIVHISCLSSIHCIHHFCCYRATVQVITCALCISQSEYYSCVNVYLIITNAVFCSICKISSTLSPFHKSSNKAPTRMRHPQICCKRRPIHGKISVVKDISLRYHRQNLGVKDISSVSHTSRKALPLKNLERKSAAAKTTF